MPGWGLYTGALGFGDFNNDGNLDIAIVGREISSTPRFRVFRNNGDGTFNWTEPQPGWGVHGSSLACADFNNDGSLDIAVTGNDGSGYKFRIYYFDGFGNFLSLEEPAGAWGVFGSALASADFDNDGDADIAITGYDELLMRRFRVYKNIIGTVNNTPTTPTGMTAYACGSYWRLQWDRAGDLLTPQNLLRYQVAIGTNSSGVYNYQSANIMFSPGQANIGNVVITTGSTPYYQTSIPVSKTIYWKVCAIDSAFKSSPDCSEQIAMPYSGPFYVDDSGKDSNMGTRSQPFRTIQKAAQMMMLGPPFCTKSTCYINPGTYYAQSVFIYTNNNPGYMVFTKLSNEMPVLFGPVPGTPAFTLTNTSRVVISGLVTKFYTNGIMIKGAATNNIITRNTICSNDHGGIWLISDSADRNIISLNNIYGRPLQNNGIIIADGDNNLIVSNISHDHEDDGIYLSGSARSNIVRYNTCYNNHWRDILLVNADTDYNDISYNRCYESSTGWGIQLDAGDYNTICSNIIHNEEEGMHIVSATHNYFTKNIIYSNNIYGINFHSAFASNNYVLSNNIWGASQDYGIRILNGDKEQIYDNAIHNNQLYGIYIWGSTNSVITRNILSGNPGALYYENSYAQVYLNTIEAVPQPV